MACLPSIRCKFYLTGVGPSPSIIAMDHVFNCPAKQAAPFNSTLLVNSNII